VSERAGPPGGSPAQPSAPIWIYAPDLMDRSRLQAAHPAAVVAASPAALLDAPRSAVILVDLGRPGVLDVLPRLGAVRTVGFASHVDDDLLAAARAAGCDEVLARSVFFRRWAVGAH
jgi:hypothetical protein